MKRITWVIVIFVHKYLYKSNKIKLYPHLSFAA
jgi:hypothetical protein